MDKEQRRQSSLICLFTLQRLTAPKAGPELGKSQVDRRVPQIQVPETSPLPPGVCICRKLKAEARVGKQSQALLGPQHRHQEPGALPQNVGPAALAPVPCFSLSALDCLGCSICLSPVALDITLRDPSHWMSPCWTPAAPDGATLGLCLQGVLWLWK